jgi:hypothetical protein
VATPVGERGIMAANHPPQRQHARIDHEVPHWEGLVRVPAKHLALAQRGWAPGEVRANRKTWCQYPLSTQTDTTVHDIEPPCFYRAVAPPLPPHGIVDRRTPHPQHAHRRKQHRRHDRRAVERPPEKTPHVAFAFGNAPHSGQRAGVARRSYPHERQRPICCRRRRRSRVSDTHHCHAITRRNPDVPTHVASSSACPERSGRTESGIMAMHTVINPSTTPTAAKLNAHRRRRLMGGDDTAPRRERAAPDQPKRPIAEGVKFTCSVDAFMQAVERALDKV